MSIEKQKLALKLVGQAAKALELVFYSKTTNHAKELFGLCEQEERGHRTWGPEFAKYHPNSASVKQCARSFGVKRVAEYLLSQEYPKGQDYLHTQKSCFIAAGIADEFRDEILKAWASLDLKAIAALDYCLLVNPEKER